MTNKYIPSIIFGLLAATVYIASTYLKIDTVCGLFTFINPICWWNILVSFLTITLVSAFVVLAILFLFVEKKQHRYFIMFFIFGAVAILNWMTPDVIPFIDEIIFTGISLISFFKSLQK